MSYRKQIIENAAPKQNDEECERNGEFTNLADARSRGPGCCGNHVKDVMMDETDNELNVQEQWDLLTVLSEDDECDKS